MGPLRVLAGGLLAAAVAGVVSLTGQGNNIFLDSRDHPAISYTAGPLSDPVSILNRRLSEGTAHLTFEPTRGYLRSVLQALEVPVESQGLVFSRTSFQAPYINPDNPRAIYFNDSVAVGWVRGAPLLEVASQDATRGIIFYALTQTAGDKPQFERQEVCLSCHITSETLGVPGLMMLSTFPVADDPNAYAGGFVSDHRRPFDQRWGGWYMTSKRAPFRNLGNVTSVAGRPDLAVSHPPELASVEGRFDTNGYLSLQSDIVALMVLEHQTHMINLVTRLGWEARVIAHQQASTPAGLAAAPGRATAKRSEDDRIEQAVIDLVDYLLFVDEVPLPGAVQGSSGFTEEFSKKGPRDTTGRSLRQFDLTRRLFRYPCSYIIYSEAFDALPASAKSAVYARMWHVLSGEESGMPYARLTLADRQAIVDILRETKKDLPTYFQSVTK